MSQRVRQALTEKANPEKAAFFPRFFKCGPGEYGEGDQFLGVTVPEQRKVARRFKNLPLSSLEELLDDPYHECRLTALFILVHQYQGAKKDPERRRHLCEFYLSKLDRVNNWDLVDSSAHKILGPQLEPQSDRALLYELADSGHLWRQRVAVIATLHFIRNHDFEDVLRLSEHFLDHPHDLIHKACGWMLREAGKKDPEVLRGFLALHHKRMPRTALRYAIEKLEPDERKKWMGK